MPWAAVGLLLLCSSSCSRAPVESPHEHEHDGGSEAAEGEAHDAHHAAEHAEACEEDVRLTPEAIVRYGVQVAPAKETALTAVIQAPARIALRSDLVVRVGAPLHGRIVALPVQVGDHVEAGALLAEIECPELGEAEAEWLRARMQADALVSSVEIAKSAYERGKQLYESVQGISLTEVQKRETDLRQAEQSLALARAESAAARSRLVLIGMQEADIDELSRSGLIVPRLQLRASIAGRVIERPVALGELVGPEEETLLALADTSRLWALAHVPEGRLGELDVGAEAAITLAVTGIEELVGSVSAIAPVLDPDTRTAEVRIDIENPTGKLLPGMYARASIRAASAGASRAIVVPDEAVQTVEGQASVFVPIDESRRTFCRHPVTVGEAVGDAIPVLSGLKEGDLVAISGTFILKAEHGKSAASHDHDH